MEFLELVKNLFLSALVLAVVGGCVYLAHRRLTDIYADRHHQQFRRQLITVGVVLFGLLIAILLLPISDTMRGQLLSLVGILLSATIALSSTTLVGNIMAGIMLKTIRNFGPGDYIRVGDYFGRVSEMDLLHIEIQTEERDLTTLPNMFLATNPVRVMRSSGTVLSVEVSLGYDVSRHTVEELLLQAATECGLTSPFVQIRDLGDYSVTYAVSGLLTELNLILSKRRELRGLTMDALHEANIEIVSPTMMNTRAYDPENLFVPANRAAPENSLSSATPDALVFDKAERAETLEKLRERHSKLKLRLKEYEAIISEHPTGTAHAAAVADKQSTETRLMRLDAVIKNREEKISDD